MNQVQGVRNLIAVNWSAPDAEVQAKLKRKLQQTTRMGSDKFQLCDFSVLR